MFVEERGKLRHRLICPLASVGTAPAQRLLFIFSERSLEGKKGKTKKEMQPKVAQKTDPLTL